MHGLQRQIVDLLPRLRRLARALARDPVDADDLVQATVERALLHQGQWRPGTRLDSWMFRIMKNAWIDESRARSRRGKVFAPEEQGETVGQDGALAMQLRLEAGDVEKAMAKLPDEQRIAVALVLVDGLSYKEAAEVLEVPQGTLTSRLVRGRMALLAHLEGDAA
ncbi:RNA polymerase sigma factor [Phenylobacterium soli]|uniref:RNA polymerase sigma factor n=1 Tax=Phenylobacterium soli TaxID=2170551 RepID=A0A328AKR3_9CAUL|nr:sigma-70 family RNA polymerase sigma factor [Phenylobacterium soli]RAK55127.1 RNA polymerase sigma factor [Phenylobacterium soli]